MTPPHRSSEPLFNAPAPVLALVGTLGLCFVVQSRWPDPEAPIALFGLTGPAVGQGQVWRLLTAMFLHGGWMHVLLNGLGALAFGAPVCRWIEGGRRGAGGAVLFYGFYLVCGLIASLGYVLVHPGGRAVLIGASGAISGLMGASSRLIDRPGALAPFFSRTVVGMAAAWGFINLLMAAGLLAVGGDGAPIAWEAHLFGYVAGLLLIGPATRLARRRN